jgi:hypothetical protein
MKPLSEIEILFFKAKNVFLNPPAKYFVEGYPDSNSFKEYYRAHENDFVFRTYKEVVVAGIFWTKKLFGTNSINDIFIKHLEYGRKKQWFNVQLVQTGNGVLIDGEKFNPFINISYSYNTVTKIKFEIGFYRFACNNGCVNGYKELTKMEIKPEHLFEIPFWLNPCLINFLVKRFEVQIKILKNTSIHGEQIQNWVEKNVSKWNISSKLVFRYVEELGSNAYTLLNILTDGASNFENELDEIDNRRIINTRHMDEDISSNSERVNRQRKVGKFLEILVDEILKTNQNHDVRIDINSPEFLLNDENIRLFDNIKIKETYKLEIGTIKF